MLSRTKIKKWLIIGFGASGQASLKLLQAMKQKVVVYDDRDLNHETKHPKQSFIDKKTALKSLETIDGGIILSPAVRKSHPILLKAGEKKIPTYSETEFSHQYITCPSIGITGTNGKSTTTMMCIHILESLGYKTAAGGNIGTPVSQIVLKDKSLDVLVLELSSFQLEQQQNNPLSVGIFTNLQPDHLDHHENFENYQKAKEKIFYSPQKDYQVFCFNNLKQKILNTRGCLPKSLKTICTSEQDKIVSKLPRFWQKHDKLNAILALKACAQVTKKKVEDLAPHLEKFQGLRHRCEVVGWIDQFPVINDSKATNVSATLSALKSQETSCTLFLGGQDKNESFAPLLELENKINRLIIFGASRNKISHQLKQTFPQLESFVSLREAMKSFCAKMEKKRNSTILFSPACSSFDEFETYKQRGQYFTQAISPYFDPKERRQNTWEHKT